MNKVELSEKQIQELFQFVRSKYVRYIDVQHELVDHLASGIEEEMEKDAQLSFDGALNLVYGRFPITGFSNFVRAKEKEMSRYWNFRAFNYFKRFMKLPMIIVSVVIYFLSASILSSFGVMPFIMLLVGISIFTFYQASQSGKKYRSMADKDVLFYSCYRNSLMSPVSGSYVFYYIWYFTDSTLTIQSPYAAVTFNLVITVFLIWTYAVVNVFPGMLDDEISKKYRHLNLA